MSSTTLSQDCYHHQLGEVSKHMQILQLEFERLISLSIVLLPSSSTSKRKRFKGVSACTLFLKHLFQMYDCLPFTQPLSFFSKCSTCSKLDIFFCTKLYYSQMMPTNNNLHYSTISWQSSSKDQVLSRLP